MIRQEIVVCQGCGILKELGEDCECSDEKEKPLSSKSARQDGNDNDGERF